MLNKSSVYPRNNLIVIHTWIGTVNPNNGKQHHKAKEKAINICNVVVHSNNILLNEKAGSLKIKIEEVVPAVTDGQGRLEKEPMSEVYSWWESYTLVFSMDSGL